jgi:hypothetical protein
MSWILALAAKEKFNPETATDWALFETAAFLRTIAEYLREPTFPHGRST